MKNTNMVGFYDVERTPSEGAEKYPDISKKRLVPVTGISCFLPYHLDGRPGAVPHPFLAQVTFEALRIAAKLLMKKTAGRCSFLVWDAYRTLETQQSLFDDQMEVTRRAHPGKTSEEIEALVCNFVRPPRRDLPPPHTTGGAVDVTLLQDGQIMPLGFFDDFTEYGAADYFDTHAPNNESERLAKWGRHLEREVMLEAGFVGIQSEWWHFEFGTRYWAATTGLPIVLDTVLEMPAADGIATQEFVAPLRQPILFSGAAQVFTTHEQRAASLAGEGPRNYYARSQHPTERHLTMSLRRACGHQNWITVQSGMAAAVTAVAALMPEKGVMVMDHKVYYETQGSLRWLSHLHGWQIHCIDLTNPDVFPLVETADVIYLDSPRNWYLDAIDLVRIANEAQRIGAVTIVDTSVQPLQQLDNLQIDVTVLSLSKYPSAGMTIGGAIGTSNISLFEKIQSASAHSGNVLSPEAAATVWAQINSLEARMASVSQTAAAMRELLEGHSAVKYVRLPNAALCGGLTGGQISFHVITEELARRAELVCAHNALDPEFPFKIACTFGAHYSTVEHFASNVRHRVGRMTPDVAENEMPRDLVRIGIGNEPSSAIVAAIKFVLDSIIS